MNNTDASPSPPPPAVGATLVSAAQAAALVTDATGVIVSFNTEAERLFHCPAEDAQGRPLTDLISPLPAPFPGAAESDGAGYLFLASGRRPDETMFPLEVTLTQIALGDRRIVSVTLRRPEPFFSSSEAALTDDKYRLFFEYSPQPMWVFDDETLNFLAVNQAAVDQYGFSRDDFLSQTVCDIRPPEDVPKFLQDVDRHARRPDYRDEWRHRRKDGTVIWVEIKSHPITYEGRSARLVAATDITARKTAEAALRESEERLRTVVSNAPLLLFALDGDGAFTLSEGRALEVLGRRPGEAVGHSIFSRYAREPEVIQSARLALAGEPVHVIWQRNRVAFDMHYTPIKDPDGQVVSVIGVGTDITDRLRMERALRQTQEELETRVSERTADLKVVNDFLHCEVAERERAEEDLRESEARLRTIAEATPVAVTITRADTGDLLFANAHFRRLIGLAEDAPVSGLGAHDFYADARDRGKLMAALDQNGSVRSAEVRLKRLDGVSFWASGSLQWMMLGGEPVLFAAYDDITERKRADEALRRAEADLLRFNSDLTQAYDATIEGWSRALDLRDHETEGHTRRVTEMTLQLARLMRVPEADLVHVRRGALLHDIGKMGIPDRILLKPGPLNDDEWAVMRRHPAYAFELLSPIEFLHPALDIPHCHHEKWDGTGYPRGLRGERIPLAARIFAIGDVWDALRSHRPYREGWPAERVRAHVQALSGQHFDPQVVEAFLQMDLSQF